MRKVYSVSYKNNTNECFFGKRKNISLFLDKLYINKVNCAPNQIKCIFGYGIRSGRIFEKAKAINNFGR